MKLKSIFYGIGQILVIGNCKCKWRSKFTNDDEKLYMFVVSLSKKGNAKQLLN